MNVAELIAQLKEMEPDRIVIISSDAEGNSFSPLHSVEEDGYMAETTWKGEVSDEGEPAVVLWPTN